MKYKDISMGVKLLICLLFIFGITALLSVDFSTNDVDAQSQTCGCDITPFTPPQDDPVTRGLEAGGVVWEGEKPELKNARHCFQQGAEERGATNFTVTTIMRSLSYQRHLREVWDKQKALYKLTSKQRTACAEMIQEINREWNHHGITDKPSSGSGTGSSAQHVQGKAFDINWYSMQGITESQILAAAKVCGLCRPVGGDEVHFGLAVDFPDKCLRRQR